MRRPINHDGVAKARLLIAGTTLFCANEVVSEMSPEAATTGNNLAHYARGIHRRRGKRGNRVLQKYVAAGSPNTCLHVVMAPKSVRKLN